MPTKTTDDPESFSYRTPWRWRLCFLALSLLALTMSLVPWFHLLRSEHFTNAWAILVLIVFTALPMMLGSYLLFFSLRSVHFSCANKTVFRTLKLFGIGRTKTLEFGQVTLERAAFGQRNPRLWLAIYGHDRQSKSLIANEQTCDSVLELYTWFEKRHHLRCVDKSKRQPNGG